MVWLDGRLLPLEEARISPLDRGFLFGDLTWAINERLDLTAGARYAFDEKEIDSVVLERAAGQAVALGGDPARLAVTGNSGGGNFSAVLCQLARVRKGPNIAFQVLAYPVVDLSVVADYPSRKACGTGEYFLSQADMDWIMGMYFTDQAREGSNLLASPILAPDLAGLPTALIITAGFDPLVDEGRRYGQRLTAAGVPVEYRRFHSTIHGFMSFAGVPDAGREGLELVAARLRSHLQR